MITAQHKRILKLLSTEKSTVQITAIVGKDVTRLLMTLLYKDLAAKDSSGAYPIWRRTKLGDDYVRIMSRLGEL